MGVRISYVNVGGTRRWVWIKLMRDAGTLWRQ